MDRTFASGAAASPPSAPVSPSSGYPIPGNAGAGTSATKPGAWWYYMMTEEVRKVITDAGLTPDGTSVSQLSLAIQTLIEARAGNYSTDTGAANAYVIALSPAITAYTNGLTIRFRIGHSCTGASTINAGGGVVSLLRDDVSATQLGDLPAGTIVAASFDTTANGFLINSLVPSQVLSSSGGSLSGALNLAKGTSVAAAATTNIWATDGNTIHVTGTGGPITSFGTAPQAGAWREVIVDSASVVITNGSNLGCPEGYDFVTAAGDRLWVIADTTTAHRIAAYTRAGVTVALGSFTRDLTLASGSQTISGLPFKPKRIRFTLSTGTTTGFSVGDATIDGSAQCTYQDQTAQWINYAAPAIAVKAASTYQSLAIGAWNTDGFRADWTKVGSPTGTATVQYRAEM